MKEILSIFTILTTISLYAETIDAIALIVEGEPVTTSEIHAIQTRGHITKQQAIDLLIQDRLQRVAMKDISIPEADIDREISRIVKQNEISIQKMQQLLKQQGMAWSQYRKSIRNALKQKRFFREIAASSIPTPTENELRLFYRNHKEEFAIPSLISVTEYIAATEKEIKIFLKTKNSKGISSKQVIKKTKEINNAILGILLQTSNGDYTNPINAGDKWVVYQVHTKSGIAQMPFDAARGAVAARWQQQQQEQVLKDYFKKMKTEANIQYLRT
ncbi:MAG: peptidyl-prolyl cis-trans isomerase [Sulfurovum sp.]|nr:peptidyl-prolyl cis-trans isomerase [Sulfurovum sp.]MCB4757843.1 peptidyl-prolyl cis-trans isomerase [Sulfurovum sp.]MCB4760260.1 peptidyl-prolyl cis-trans isomerase [Sulfurovum sp.]